MDRIVENGLLYDFYGALLTEHQRQVYEDAVYQDMTLTEIAAAHGVSRQAAHDLIKRCNKLLESYEAKLHLVAKFADAREVLQEINRLAEESSSLPESLQRGQIDRIRETAGKLLESF